MCSGCTRLGSQREYVCFSLALHRVHPCENQNRSAIPPTKSNSQNLKPDNQLPAIYVFRGSSGIKETICLPTESNSLCHISAINRIWWWKVSRCFLSYAHETAFPSKTPLNRWLLPPSSIVFLSHSFTCSEVTSFEMLLVLCIFMLQLLCQMQHIFLPALCKGVHNHLA